MPSPPDAASSATSSPGGADSGSGRGSMRVSWTTTRRPATPSALAAAAAASPSVSPSSCVSGSASWTTANAAASAPAATRSRATTSSARRLAGTRRSRCRLTGCAPRAAGRCRASPSCRPARPSGPREPGRRGRSPSRPGRRGCASPAHTVRPRQRRGRSAPLAEARHQVGPEPDSLRDLPGRRLLERGHRCARDHPTRAEDGVAPGAVLGEQPASVRLGAVGDVGCGQPRPAQGNAKTATRSAAGRRRRTPAAPDGGVRPGSESAAPRRQLKDRRLGHRHRREPGARPRVPRACIPRQELQLST